MKLRPKVAIHIQHRSHLGRKLIFSYPSLLHKVVLSLLVDSIIKMSSNNASNLSPTKPIPINTRRGRSESVSDSSSSEGSASPVSPIQSPLSAMQPRVAAASPTSAPILSYFLSQSPKSPGSTTFPFRRGFGTAVFEGKSVSIKRLHGANLNPAQMTLSLISRCPRIMRVVRAPPFGQVQSVSLLLPKTPRPRPRRTVLQGCFAGSPWVAQRFE